MANHSNRGDRYSTAIAQAVQNYVDVAPNAHLGDTPECEDRAYAYDVIYGSIDLPSGIARLDSISASMEDM